MSDLATLIAQSSGGNQQPASDPAMAAVKLARASIDALVLKLGQSIAARVVGQLPAGLTQLAAGSESFVLKLETPLPTGTTVTIRVAPTLQGTPAITVSVPPATPHAAPLPVATPTAPLVQPSGPQATPPPPTTPQALPQARQLPLAEPAARPALTLPPNPPSSQALQQSAAPAASVPTPPASPPQPAPKGTIPAATVAATPAAVRAPATPPTTPVATAPPSPPTVQAPPSPGQPAAQVPLPVMPASPANATQPAPTLAPQPALAAPPASATQVAEVPAATSPVIAAPPAASLTSPVAATMPTIPPTASAPILAAPLQAQPPQPLPTHPSPYPVHVPQASVAAVAQQLPLGAAPETLAAARPAAPQLNLADPAQAAARQDSAAPLLAKLASIVTAAAPSLPRPVIEVALKVLASRVDLNRGAPDAKTLEVAVLKAGVLLIPTGRDAPTDGKSTLLALRSALLGLIGGDATAPALPADRPAPPIKGEPPRAPTPQPALADLPANGQDTARALLGQTDAALSRLKLLQGASQPAPDTRVDAPAPRNELRVEIPVLLGTETGILQLLVERDGKHKRDSHRERGWRMRFAMNFSETGEVGADIAMLGHSASIAIWAADPGLADALDDMLPELAPAIQQHGLELTSLRVRRGVPRSARTAPGQLLDSAR